VTDTNVFQLSQPGTFSDLLTEVLRNGARTLLAQAVEAEVAAWLVSHADKLTDDGRQRLVRHGHLPEREIVTGIGPVAVRCPRVRDRAGEGSERIRFTARGGTILRHCDGSSSSKKKPSDNRKTFESGHPRFSSKVFKPHSPRRANKTNSWTASFRLTKCDGPFHVSLQYSGNLCAFEVPNLLMGSKYFFLSVRPRDYFPQKRTWT
jgi:hypothetical protein